MTPQEVDRFFETLAGWLEEPVRVVMTGAAAGALQGYIRPSQDVDFAIRPARKKTGSWQRIEAAIERTMKETGIPANYAEDIDRWGTISLMDYWDHTQPYRKFGGVDVRILDPAYWSIGKLSRSLDSDLKDVIAVFSGKKVPWNRVVRLWGRALKSSPPSTDRFQFRQRIERFLKDYGRVIWGRGFSPEKATQQFHRAAGIS